MFAYFKQEPTLKDAVILCCFVVLILFQPYFLYGEINIFEVGLYLPGINAILHGMVPYRDFFHLRGPLELYMPALLMSLFGVSISVLSAYFYFGTVLCFLVCVFIAKELYRTRFILYLMVPVLVARTFPRVYFTWWGGMRYAFGLLVIFCAIKFFKRGKNLWLFIAGIFSACGFFTSAEIGVLSAAGVFAALIFSGAGRLQEGNAVFKSIGVFLLGAVSVAFPYFLYLAMAHALIPFVDSVYAVLVNKEHIIDTTLLVGVPDTLPKALMAMVNPTLKNFRQMTPMYTYLILFLYIACRARRRRLTAVDRGLVGVGVYGFTMHVAAIKNIWAAQFEMALQPEKILLFFVFEELYFLLRARGERLAEAIRSLQATSRAARSARLKIYGLSVLFAGFVIFSLWYSIDRYNKRFFAAKCIRNTLSGKGCAEFAPLAESEKRPLRLDRAKGMVVPVEQAEELETVVGFLRNNTRPDEIVLMYPELGTYSFLADRPFLGKFPIATFSWFNDAWHEEFIATLKTVKPRFAVLPKSLREDWIRGYFHAKKNRDKYSQAMNFIASNYNLRTATPASFIYERKSP